MQIEVNMEIIREEMKLLSVIDQTGSSIDSYVASLEALLQHKAAGESCG